MTTLWLGAIPLILLALLAAAWPLFGFRAQHTRVMEAANRRRQANVQLYREHLAELERDLAAGRITDEQYQQLHTEAQRNLLEDEALRVSPDSNSRGRGLLGLAALLAVALGLGLYLWRGNAADVQLAERHRQLLAADMADYQQRNSPGPERTREIISLLRERAEERTDNAQYWYLLARYQLALGEIDGATEALRQVRRLHPEDAGNTAQLAQALFLQGNNRITGEIRDLVRDALFTDPQEPTALGLAGIDAYQSGDYRAAIDYWGRVLPTLPRESQTYRALSAGIERARQQLGEEAPAESGDTAGWRLPVTVSLAEDLALPAGATLFVLVREAGGSPMPLLVTRRPADQFPMSIVMNETMAMTTIGDLNQLQRLEVVARISLSGDASPASGDLQGSSGGLDATALPERVEVRIDRRLP